MSENKKTEPEEAACARKLGRLIRGLLRKRDLGDLKVSCRVVSFESLGYGGTCFADIEMGDSKLDDETAAALADLLHEIRYTPYAAGGGRALVSLKGRQYSFGGTIGHRNSANFKADDKS
jgi:hypothetical protein